MPKALHQNRNRKIIWKGTKVEKNVRMDIRLNPKYPISLK